MYFEASAPDDNGYDSCTECVEFRSIPRIAAYGEAVAVAPATALSRLLMQSAADPGVSKRHAEITTRSTLTLAAYHRLSVATESNSPRRFANSDVACTQRLLRQSQTSDLIRSGQGAYSCGLTCGAAALMDQSPSTRA